ncbi:hypothetical protein DTO195F2_4963 [Paecilomyces variotii]|nr:hypothetical protein DTO195F2_4963 [Paecilomyces variotii]KAJ9362442.1 hypothetical protein DTO027B9_119 [Paecilomyces variotii]
MSLDSWNCGSGVCTILYTTCGRGLYGLPLDSHAPLARPFRSAPQPRPFRPPDPTFSPGLALCDLPLLDSPAPTQVYQCIPNGRYYWARALSIAILPATGCTEAGSRPSSRIGPCPALRAALIAPSDTITPSLFRLHGALYSRQDSPPSSHSQALVLLRTGKSSALRI